MKNVLKQVVAGAAILATIVTTGCAIKSLVSVETKNALSKMTTKPSHPGVVRLVDENGRNFCTAFIVSDTIALTATHCLVSNGQFGMQVNADTFIQSDDRKHTVEANVFSVGPRQDVAVLSGDFKKFTKLKFSSSPADDILANNYSLSNCGYPYGGKLVCYSLDGAYKAIDMVGFTKGQMYAGMSGGPVLDLKTGIVYGVNHAVTIGAVIIAPLVNVFFGQSILE